MSADECRVGGGRAIRRANARRALRVMAAATTGGLLLQTASCATTLTTFAPLALSFIENVALSQLFAGLNGF